MPTPIPRVPRKPYASAASAFACLAVLGTTSAHADSVPHFDLTPYQIVQAGGQCLQVTPGSAAILAACSLVNSFQKFYLLIPGDADVTPQTQTDAGVEVRVAAGYTFDAAPTPVGQYNLLALVNGVLTVDPTSTINADNAHRWMISRVPTSLSDLVKVADENATFTVAGTRVVQYGASGHWITKTISGLSYPNAPTPCTNATFGGDPLPGVVKACYLQAPSNEAFTQYVVKFVNRQNSACMGVSIFGGFGLVPCAPSSTDLQTFWLRPTSYPGVL